MEGSNTDDNGDYRPGLQAVAELDIKSPLRYAQMSKDDIRALSKYLNLPTWEKQSFACLSSRFVYGETITQKKTWHGRQSRAVIIRSWFSSGQSAYPRWWIWRPAIPQEPLHELK